MKLKSIFIFIFLISMISVGYGQCAMCTAVAEEAMRNGSSQGAGINKGVLYLFVTPYLLVATIGFIWWRKRVKAKEEIELDSAKEI